MSTFSWTLILPMDQNPPHPLLAFSLSFSSRDDTGLMLGLLLISAERESETEGKGGKVCGSNLMI
jgi:hypothetical protein